MQFDDAFETAILGPIEYGYAGLNQDRVEREQFTSRIPPPRDRVAISAQHPIGPQNVERESKFETFSGHPADRHPILARVFGTIVSASESLGLNNIERMTDTEKLFDRYWQTLETTDPLHTARILNLAAAKSAEVRNLAKAFTDIKAEINQRFAKNAVDIISPAGSPQIHMDYVASSEVNAFAFQFEGWYFIALTEGMLELFTKSCSDLWHLSSLLGHLGIVDAAEKRNAIFQFILLLELQYIANHELGHMFHGHCTDLNKGRYRSEFSVQVMVAESIGMEGQAKELEADGYAINLLLINLLQSYSGKQMHDRVESTRPVCEFVLMIFVLSLGAVLYYLKPFPFDPSKVRMAEHTKGLARMNVLLREINGWCKMNFDWDDALPLGKFQEIMSFVADAASNTIQDEIWSAQGKHLQTDQGQRYLADIYDRRVTLRSKMSPSHWKLKSEMTTPK